jgi:hypothetical protein
MRIKIIAAIFIFFYSMPGFSQTRTLLHTFESRLRNNPSAMNGVMNFYGERKEDYTIRLFSDSTFTINYSYSATGNYYRNYKTSETAIGSFFNKDGVVYLVRNNLVLYSNQFYLDSIPKRLEQMLALGVPVKIEYSDNSMALYNAGGWSMVFMKKNSLKLREADK